MADTTRDEHLNWCKERALAEITRGDPAGAVASMISDLGKWDGGPLYDPSVLNLLTLDAMMFRKTPAEVRHWIEGFN